MLPVAVAVLKQRREADAALFSELHRKLQTQVGVLVCWHTPHRSHVEATDALASPHPQPSHLQPSYVSLPVPQSVLKHRWSVLYLLLSLAEDPRKPSGRVRNGGAESQPACCIFDVLSARDRKVRAHTQHPVTNTAQRERTPDTCKISGSSIAPFVC